MKLLLIFLLALSVYGASKPEKPVAPSGLYIETNIDYPSSDSMNYDDVKYKYDAGLSGALAIGYQMDRWRFELEGNYSKDDIEELKSATVEDATGKIKKEGGLVNVYYSAYNDSNLVSSIGLGAGVTNIETDKLKVNDVAAEDTSVDSSFTYQATMSLGYMVGEDWTWTVKYRYLNIDDLKDTTSTFSLGIRYLF